MASKHRVAINGFGRIGRLALRALLAKKNLEVVAINDLSDARTLAHLYKYDSTYGINQSHISTAGGDKIIIDNHTIQASSEREPTQLPWRECGVDIVLDCTGRFLDHPSLSKHLEAGAKRVILSAPPADALIPTVVLGVNEKILTGEEKIISNASCTTNCLAPIAKILEENFGIEYGCMTTIHAYTSDQNLLDGSHKDLRRARSAARSIIPTSTGATKSLGLVIPSLKEKISGMSVRVPVECGSCIDLSVVLRKKVSKEILNQTIKIAADTYLRGIIEYTEEELVSKDIIGNKHSAVFDALLTTVSGDMVKILAWYDNEMAYAQRMADLAEFIVYLRQG